MDESTTSQADFLGNLSMVLIVLWVLGGAFFLMVGTRGEAVNLEIASAASAAAAQAAAPATPAAP